METLQLGKVPWEILAFIVQKHGFMSNKGIIQRPERGVDVAVLDLKEIIDQINKTYKTESIPYLVYKADPITFPTPNPAESLIIVNKNDLATAGAIPYGITSTILMPSYSLKSDLLALQENLSEICEKERITILGGHTEITQGVQHPILSASMIGFVPPEYYIPRKPQTGDRIICAGWVGAEGTGILLNEEKNFFLDNISTVEFQSGIDLGNRLDISRNVIECNKVWHDALHLVHDATEGGILGAIYECLMPKGFGCEINLSEVPMSPVTMKIAEILDINPYKLISSGAVLFICASDEASNVVQFLNGTGLPTSDIGRVGNKNSQIRVNGSICGPPESDHLIKGLKRLAILTKRD